MCGEWAGSLVVQKVGRADMGCRRRSFENIRQVVKKTVGMSKERARGFAMVAHPR